MSIRGKKVLAVITARGGSKGVPGKNIKPLAGKPLIAWTIETARQSKYIDRLVLSSEDDAIIQTAMEYGCESPFRRPDELALDDTPGIDPVIHAIGQLPGYDIVMLLQPTSPLRSTEDIDASLELMLSREAPAVVSVTEPDKSPYWMFQMDDNLRLKPVTGTMLAVRRQELPPVYALNGAVYAAETKCILEQRSFLHEKAVAYQMTRERSLDLDTSLDFAFCEWYLSQEKK